MLKKNTTKPRMPRRPENFETVVGIDTKLPTGVEPKRGPRKPVHVVSYLDISAINDMFLYAQSKYWILYAQLDDAEMDIDAADAWVVCGYAKRKGEKPEVAAAYLLLDFFKETKDYMGLDETPGLWSLGLLTLGPVNAIWKEVWGEVPSYGYHFVYAKDKR